MRRQAAHRFLSEDHQVRSQTRLSKNMANEFNQAVQATILVTLILIVKFGV